MIHHTELLSVISCNRRPFAQSFQGLRKTWAYLQPSRSGTCCCKTPPLPPASCSNNPHATCNISSSNSWHNYVQACYRTKLKANYDATRLNLLLYRIYTILKLTFIILTRNLHKRLKLTAILTRSLRKHLKLTSLCNLYQQEENCTRQTNASLKEIEDFKVIRLTIAWSSAVSPQQLSWWYLSCPTKWLSWCWHGGACILQKQDLEEDL